MPSRSIFIFQGVPFELSCHCTLCVCANATDNCYMCTVNKKVSQMSACILGTMSVNYVVRCFKEFLETAAFSVSCNMIKQVIHLYFRWREGQHLVRGRDESGWRHFGARGRKGT